MEKKDILLAYSGDTDFKDTLLIIIDSQNGTVYSSSISIGTDSSLRIVGQLDFMFLLFGQISSNDDDDGLTTLGSTASKKNPF